MLFMGSKYAKIAFVAWAPPRPPLGELKRSLRPSSRNIGPTSKGKGRVVEGEERKGR